MLLTSDEHCIGRVVKDVTFQIVSPAVSANHCKIYRKIVAAGDGNNSSSFFTSVFLKDSRFLTSFVNGAYLMHFCFTFSDFFLLGTLAVQMGLILTGKS